MSAASLAEADRAKEQVRQVEQLVQDAVQSGFTGCLELHFRAGVPESAKRVETLRLRSDLTSKG